MAEIDYALRRQVGDLQNMIVSVGQSVSVVGQQVEAVGHQQQAVQGELADLRNRFQEFIQQSEWRHNIQVAETKIGSLQDEIEHRYGHHKVVRQTSVGMLQAFDVGLVSEETVRAVGEQLMVQTPRYWLAPVLVALAAWAGDDRELCDRAVAEAFRRSPSKTSLFFALLLRRQARQASAVRWLRHYLNAQDPAALGRDFAVILESISQGAFGPAGRELVRDYTEPWRQRLLEDQAALRAQIDRWRAEIDAQVDGPEPARFPRLAAFSPQWPALAQGLARACTHQRLLAKYQALAVEEIQPMDRLEDAVDDILDRLVQEYDTEELPLRRDLDYQRAVVQQGGNLAAAKHAVEIDSASLETTLDFLTIQTTSALNPAAIGVSRATQRMAVGTCHDWFAQAHATFTMDYRAGLPARVDVALGANHNPGAELLKLPTWSGAFTTPLDQLERSLTQHWDEHGRPYIGAFSYNARKHVALLVGVMLAVLVVVSICLHPGAGLLLGLVGAGIWAIVISERKKDAERKQQQARELVEGSKQDSLAQLRATGAELTDWTTAFHEADRQEEEVRTMIADLATIGQARSPYERRVVAPRPVPDTHTGVIHG